MVAAGIFRLFYTVTRLFLRDETPAYGLLGLNDVTMVTVGTVRWVADLWCLARGGSGATLTTAADTAGDTRCSGSEAGAGGTACVTPVGASPGIDT